MMSKYKITTVEGFQDHFRLDPALCVFILSRWRRAVQFLIGDLEDFVVLWRCLPLFHEKATVQGCLEVGFILGLFLLLQVKR